MPSQVAVVVGAARGIGRAAAERLAHDGASVIGVDQNGEALAQTMRTISMTGAEAKAISLRRHRAK